MKVDIREEDLVLIETAVDAASAMTLQAAKTLQAVHANDHEKAKMKEHLDRYVHEWDRQMTYFFRFRRISEELEKVRMGLAAVRPETEKK